MEITVRIQAKNGIITRVDIDNGVGEMWIDKWKGWCLRSYSFRMYLLKMKERGAAFTLNGKPLKVQYKGLFKRVVITTQCGCGCGELLTYRGIYVPDHKPPYLKSGHRTKMIRGRIPGSFRKGHVSWNKGKKGYCPPGSEKGWFKKGGLSPRWNDYPTPGIRTDKDGYVYALVEDPEDRHPCGHRRYENVARVTMEKHLGHPLDDFEIVLHLDGNPSNNDIDNLKVVTRARSLKINREKYLRERGIVPKKQKEKRRPSQDKKRPAKKSQPKRTKKTYSPFCKKCGTLKRPSGRCPLCKRK